MINFVYAHLLSILQPDSNNYGSGFNKFSEQNHVRYLLKRRYRNYCIGNHKYCSFVGYDLHSKMHVFAYIYCTVNVHLCFKHIASNFYVIWSEAIVYWSKQLLYSIYNQLLQGGSTLALVLRLLPNTLKSPF